MRFMNRLIAVVVAVVVVIENVLFNVYKGVFIFATFLTFRKSTFNNLMWVDISITGTNRISSTKIASENVLKIGPLLYTPTL